MFESEILPSGNPDSSQKQHALDSPAAISGLTRGRVDKVRVPKTSGRLTPAASCCVVDVEPLHFWMEKNPAQRTGSRGEDGSTKADRVIARTQVQISLSRRSSRMSALGAAQADPCSSKLRSGKLACLHLTPCELVAQHGPKLNLVTSKRDDAAALSGGSLHPAERAYRAVLLALMIFPDTRNVNTDRVDSTPLSRSRDAKC
jgi:hypothetical protein